MGASKTTDHIHIQIKIKKQNLSQEPLAPIKAPKQDIKDWDVLGTFKVNRDRQTSKHGCLKDHWPYPSQDQGAKLDSGTFSLLQSCNKESRGIFSISFVMVNVMIREKSNERNEIHLQVKIHSFSKSWMCQGQDFNKCKTLTKFGMLLSKPNNCKICIIQS